MNKLPPAPRLLIEGDATAAAPFVGLAKKLARQCYRGGVRAKSYLVAAGTTIRVENYPESYLSKVFIRSAAPGSFPFLAVTWEPEGIVLTPRTAAAPYGYGFPKRDAETGELINAPFGTRIEDEDDSALNQVLINQFENNKYLDRAEYISGIPEVNGQPVFKLPETNPRLRDAVATEIPRKTHYTVIYWPLFYTPAGIGENFWDQDENRLKWIDVPGINRWTGGLNFKPKKNPEINEEGAIVGEIPYRQFDENGQSLIYEAETSTWYCHWPEELLYDSDAAEALFQTTNGYRAAVGREPLTREIRGFANVGRMVCSEMQRSGTMYHNNEVDYRPGYGRLSHRFIHGGSNAFYYGENLLSITPSGKDWESGTDAADWWRLSPPHYAIMISTEFDMPKYSTTHDVFHGASATISEGGNEKEVPQVYDPPVAGKVWAQSFVKRHQWLYGGGVVQEGDYGSTTLFHFTSPIGPGMVSDDSVVDIDNLINRRSFYYKGRFVTNNQAALPNVTYEHIILGVVACIEDGVLLFRSIWYVRLFNGTRLLQSWVRPINAHHENWVLENSNDTVLAEMAYNINFQDTVFILTKFSFKTDGSHGVITVCKNKMTDRPTFFNPTDGEATRMNVVHSIIQYSPDSGFSEMTEVVGPDITYTFTAPNELSPPYTYTQVGSGFISSYPQYNASNTLVYLKLHYEMNVQNGPDKISGNYDVRQWLEFSSGNIFNLTDIHIYYATNNPALDDPVVEIGSFGTHLLYLDPINEDVVYYKVDLSVGNNEDWLNDRNIVFNQNPLEGRVSLFYNQTELNVASDIDFPVQFFWQVAQAWYAWFAPSTPSISYTEEGFLNNGMYDFYHMHHSFQDIRKPAYTNNLIYSDSSYISTQFILSPSWSTINGSVFLSGGSPYIHTGKMLTGTMPVCLGFRTALGDVISCTTTHMQSGYNFGIPMATRSHKLRLYGSPTEVIEDDNRERVHCWFARYKDRVIMQIDWDFEAQGSNGYIWKAKWPAGDAGHRTIYANFDIWTEVGLGDLTDILPMGVV